MEKSLKKNGFIAISMIYSVFILFVTILIAIMFSYITDRKSSNAIKEDIKARFSAKLPEVVYTNVDNLGASRIDVMVTARRGNFPISNIKYIWSKNQSAIPNKVIGNGGIASLSWDEEPGDWYLITRACDVFENCTVTISTKYTVYESATLVTGSQFNSTLTSIASNVSGGSANIISFRRSQEIDNAYKTNNNIISTSGSSYPVYAYCLRENQSSLNCYYYTEAPKVKFNADSSGMFQNLDKLITVDLGDFDKSSLSGVSNMFTGCSMLENIKTPIAYDGAPSIVLPGTYYSDVSIPYTHILGTTPSKIWITKDLTTYEITYDLDGGTLDQDNPVAYNRNSKTITLNNPTKEGYIFAGWSGGKNLVSYSKAGQYNDVTMNGDEIIYDRSTVENNRGRGIQLITYRPSNSTWDVISDIADTDCSGKKEVTFTRHGSVNNLIYLKLDTSKSDGIFELSTTEFADETEYTASFTIDSFNANRAMATVSNFQVERGSRATPFERRAEKEMRLVIPHGSQGNRKYYANWIKSSDSKYTVEIDPNGGDWYGHKDKTSKKLEYGEVFDIPNPTKEGHVFNGWSELTSALPAAQKNNPNYAITNATVYCNVCGSLTHEIQGKSLDNPLTMTTSQLKIYNSGSSQTKPGLGGFVNTVNPQNSHTYVHVFVAKLDDGFYFHNAHNAIGTGGSTQWLTSNRGTGKWQVYAYKHTTGTGSLGTFGHVYISASASNTWDVNNAETRAVTAYIGYSNIYDITSNNNGIGQLDGTAKLTASWTPVKTLTINPNGGKYIYDTNNYVVKGYNGYKANIRNDLTKNGYIFAGWDTSSGNITLDESKLTPISKSTVTLNSSTADTSYGVYNSGTSGAVKITKEASDFKIVTSGSANPGAGGFYTYQHPLSLGKIYTVKIEANIPVGYELRLAGISRMYTGIGSSAYPINGDNLGTGSFKTYEYVVHEGTTGSTIASHIYIYVQSTGSASNTNVTWYAKNVTVSVYNPFNFVSNYTLPNSDSTLTARWEAGGSAIAFDPNEGTFNSTYVYNWGNDFIQKDGTFYRYYYYNTSYGTHPGSTNYNWTPDYRVMSLEGDLQGWFTSASGGTKIFNGDGTLVSGVSGYSDSSSKWKKYNSNVTLYAQYIPLVDLDASNCSSAQNVSMNTTGSWRVTNGAGNRLSVMKGINYGSTYSDLPTPTSTNCTFTGWYTVASCGSPTILSRPATETKWNYINIKYNLMPGATYRVNVNKSVVKAGTVTSYSAKVFDFTLNKELSAATVNIGSNQSFNIAVPTTITYTEGSSTITKVIERNHDVRLIFYAGIAGDTGGKSIEFQKINLGTYTQSGDLTQAQITNSNTYGLNRNAQYFAACTCS